MSSLAAPPVDGAWSRFQRLDRDRPIDVYAALLGALSESVTTFNLDPSAVTLAAEVVALAPPSTVERRAALTVLVLITLIDTGQGCTRTPIAGPVGAGHLRGRFDALLSGVGWVGDLPGDALARLLIAELDAIWASNPGGDASGAMPGAMSDAMGDAIVPSPVDLIGGADDFTPLVVRGPWLYHQRMLNAEVRLAERLAARIDSHRDAPGVDAALDAVRLHPAGVTLSDEQRAAVRQAATGGLTLVSGGPGTGKTSIVVALLRVLVRLGVASDAIALAAPTGKAAWRMGAAIRAGLERLGDTPPEADVALVEGAPEPMTLHRLLGYAPSLDRFRHHAGDTLDAEVIIVDECSMIDVFLMERLTAAARPDALLILLGDADQLPSVAAGAVFRDALDALPTHRVRLTHSFRMRADDPAGRAVLTVARRLNRGETPDGLRAPLADGSVPFETRETPGALVGEGVEHLAANQRRAFLEHWYRSYVRGDAALDGLRARSWPRVEGRIADEAAADLAPLFAWLESARLLCLTRKRDAGADRTNLRLHAFAARRAGRPAEQRFLVGEPVMMLHNDYDRGLFNGDQGIILWVETDGRRSRAAVFPDLDGYRVHPLATLEGRLDLAYAMTVHKAQGSEFDRVGIIMPDEDLPLSTRELVYTGVTRSRRGVVLVGDAARIAWAAAHPVTRFSGLADHLAREETST